MNRCFTAGLREPTILAALFYDWGRTALLIHTHSRQRTVETAWLLELFAVETTRQWRISYRRAALLKARERDTRD